jgi:O-antigen biosynthesis protein
MFYLYLEKLSRFNSLFTKVYVFILCQRLRPHFDAIFYLNLYPDVKKNGIDPCEHYVRHGFKEGKLPNSEFDTKFYLSVNRDVAMSGLNPFFHYIQYGRSEGRAPNTNFDPSFYLTMYSDVAASNMDPWEHYYLYGAKEGRMANSKFDTAFYTRNNPDVAASNINPLVHYVLFGKKEKRISSQLILKDYHDFIYKSGFSMPSNEDDALKISEAISFKIENCPKVSIIVPVYNKCEYTLQCLYSIFNNQPKVSFEIILVDDCSQDYSERVLQKIKGIHYLRNSTNLGFLRSCNSASNFAKGEFICFLNNDTFTLPGWLDELFETFRNQENVGLVGSKLIYPNGRLQEAGGIFWNDATAWNYGNLENPSLPKFNYLREVDYCSGASIMIPLELFKRVNLFDERYLPAYCEDSDLAFTVRSHGLRVLYQPNSVVIHFEGISHGTDISQGIKSYQILNQKKFLKKWELELSMNHYKNSDNVFLAANRSMHKKTILIIDHYVPKHDRDAGSKTIYQLVKLFISKGLNVKFWPQNLLYDPIYTPQLQQLGVEVFYGIEYANNFHSWLNDHASYIDYFFLSRPHVAIDFIDTIRTKENMKVLYYGHDIHHLRLATQIAIDPENDYLKKEKDFFESIEEEVINKVDISYFPSDEEVEYVKKQYFDNALDAKCRRLPVYGFDRFEEANFCGLGERKGILFVAGFSHEPNEDGAIWFVRNVWPLVKAKYPDEKLFLIGSSPTTRVQALANNDIEVTGYITEKLLSKYYLQARLAIAPLRFGGGVKGKVVEAMRFGLPTVTTSFGAQGFESASTTGLFVADTPDEQFNFISALIDDDELWISSSKALTMHAKINFSIEAMWSVLSDQFDGGDD